LAVLSRRTKSGGGAAAHHFAIDNDFIVVYARNKSELKHLFVSHDETYLKRYSEEDENGKYFWDTMERTYTQTKPYIITAPDGSKLKGSWFRSEERFLEDKENGEIRFVQKNDNSWSVQFKQRLSDGKKIRSLLFEKEFRSTQDDLEALGMKEYFDFPKPVFLIKHLLEGASGKDGIVLDFFAGSATTAQAVFQINAEDFGMRKFICVQLPEQVDSKNDAYKAGFRTIADISKERIRRAAKKVREDTPLFTGDLGFKVFKLTQSNFKVWDSSLEKDQNGVQAALDLHVDHISPKAKQEGLLYEILLKAGFELSTPLKETKIEGKSVFSIAEGELLICLEKNLTHQLIKAIAEESPSRVILLDEGFQNNDQLKTNAVQIMKSKNVLNFRTV
jgi:adenine-specific DNA-methyltransferase